MDKKTVLIVDDDPNIRTMLGKHLEREGIEPSMASTGAEGLEKLKSFHPDLIILDLMMPEMDGLTFCSRVKENPDTADIPVIIVSAHSAETQRLTGQILGAVDFISKPFNPKDLIDNVRRRIGQ